MPEPSDDQGQAAIEAAARAQLLDAGAARLPRPPWLRRSQPPSAIDLVQYAIWQARTGDVNDLTAALVLLPAARAEVDQVEVAALFTARASGMSWSRISRAMGLGSAQAAQQRFDRIAGRVEHREGQ
jgi:hypothetical protein